MQELTVTSQDNRLFFDKVLAYASDHGLLTKDRLDKLADECNDFHPDACDLFGLNIFDFGQTLQAAKIVKQLLSLKLEGMSGGDVGKAVKILIKYDVHHILNSIIAEIQKELRRLHEIVQNSQRAETAFGYNVTIFRGRQQTGKRTGLVPYLAVDNFMAQANRQIHGSTKCLLETCEGLASYSLLTEWRQDIDDIEREIAVSNKFLPWAMLMEEAGLKPVSQVRNEFVWTVETMIATLCVILITGGSSKVITGSKRQLGTVCPASHLPHLTRQILVSPKFREAAVTAFADYLRSLATKSAIDPPDPSKLPNDEEYVILEELLASAMDHLLEERDKERPGNPSLDYYLERLQVAVDPKNFDQRRPFDISRSTTNQTPAERLLAAVDRGVTPATITRLLKKLSWEKADSDGLTEEILRRVDGEVLLPHLPLFPHLVTQLVSVWKTSNGQRLWPIEQRRRLALRTLTGGSDLFWKELDPSTLEEMGSINTEIKSRVEERYHIACERMKRF